jgi:hypothetical protein
MTTTRQSVPTRLVAGAIRLYQRTLSPNHGPLDQGFRGCRYYPSCSEYTVRAVEARGVTVGLLKGAWRILRCNPFSRGGVDDPSTGSG